MKGLIEGELSQFTPDPKMDLLAYRILCKVLESVLAPQEAPQSPLEAPRRRGKGRKASTSLKTSKGSKGGFKSAKYAFTCSQCGVHQPIGANGQTTCSRKMNFDCWMKTNRQRQREYHRGRYAADKKRKEKAEAPKEENVMEGFI